MHVVPEWRKLIRKAWSIRLALLSASLSTLEGVLQYVAPTQASGRFALLAGAVGLAAAVARIVAQPALHE
jgi:hypothetical protein